MDYEDRRRNLTGLRSKNSIRQIKIQKVKIKQKVLTEQGEKESKTDLMNIEKNNTLTDLKGKVR